MRQNREENFKSQISNSKLELMKGNFRIKTELEKGTKIEIQLPV